MTHPFMRRSHFSGFARSAYRNLKRAEELWPVVQEDIAAFHKRVDEKLSAIRADPAAGGTYKFHFLSPREQEMEECSAAAILMTHGAVEAYINDFAARELGERVKDELDKLSPTGKWRVIPQLAKGYIFDTSSEPFFLLKELTKARNHLAHPKSRPGDPTLPRQPDELDLLDAARKAVKALALLKNVAEEFDAGPIPNLALGNIPGFALLRRSEDLPFVPRLLTKADFEAMGELSDQTPEPFPLPLLNQKEIEDS
jgi:hypothetical protein